MLVDPRSSSEAECRRLKLDITDSQHPTFYVCQDWDCDEIGPDNISLYSDVASCTCGKPMCRELVVGGSVSDKEDDGVFTVNTSSFIISDDLRVMPNTTGFAQTLETLGITDVDGAEMRSLSFGVKNIMDLLKLALTSTTPLTDLIINSGELGDGSSVKYEDEPDNNEEECDEDEPSPDNNEEEYDSNDDKVAMILKVTLRKSSKEFLFAQAKADFVDFLLSFLTIPLGGVERILSGKTCLEGIDNLYTSVSSGGAYFTKVGPLIRPRLAHGYVSENPFLPLTQGHTPALFFLKDSASGRGIFSRKILGQQVISFKPSTPLHYVNREGLTEYIVCDDLTVTPYSVASSISILERLGVPMSDMEVRELRVGAKEALRILKASLTSTRVLSVALVVPMLEKDALKRLYDRLHTI